MGSSNNAAGQNAGARQQIDQQTTQAMQRLMQYLGQNPVQPPPGSITPGTQSAPGGMGQPRPAAPTATPQGSIGSISPQSAAMQPGMGSGGGQTLNPQQLQQLAQALAMRQRGQ
jgi:hypothetical protein